MRKKITSESKTTKENKKENAENIENQRKKTLKEDQEVINNTQNQESEIREVIVERKIGFNYIEVIIIMIITLILGAVVGSFITYIIKGPTGNSKTVVKEIPRKLEEFVETYNDIVTNYYQEIDENDLLESGIKGMLDCLEDDYSIYMNKEESESFNQEVEGKYQGVGIEITQQIDGVIKITKVFEDTPAQRGGLQIGDIITAVDGESVEGKTVSDVSETIKESTKEIKLTVLREEQSIEVNLAVEEVELESVSSKILEKNGKKVGYLKITTFAANSYTQFEKNLLELEKNGIDSLVIDVRDNSGGYLTTVTDIASLFLDKSKIIYQLDTKGVIEQIYSKTKVNRNYKIAVLINHNSASASEILAAALQESYGATIVGVTSFGKGTVQKAYQLESGAIVKYTIQKWLTPKGNWINETGVIPDIEKNLEINYYQDPSDETDNQLQTALEEVSK